MAFNWSTQSSLQDRCQRVKINTTFSSWTQLLQGVPQGSVLGDILFNIYITYIFFALKGVDICNSAYDTTPYICDSNLKAVLETLVWESNNVKLLGITLDNNLKFDEHVSNICSKAMRKLPP